MGIVPTLITIAALAGPPVEVSTFSGSEHKGELIALENGQLTITAEGMENKLPLGDVLEVRTATTPEDGTATGHEVLLTDGSRLTCQQVTSTEKLFALEHPTLGKLDIPAEFIGSIRLASPVNAVAEDWAKLTERRENTDLLVINKDGILDHLKGGVGPISEKQVQFFLGKQAATVSRSEKLYGVIYGNRSLPTAVPIVRVILANKDALQLKSLSWTGDNFQGELLAGVKVLLPIEKLTGLDFSLGKVQYLSELTPRKKKTELPFYFANEPISEIDLEYHSVKINKNFSGKPLQLGKTVYARGLCIHPRTELAYRLSKEMRRFQAVMGIDNLVAQRGLGDVQVIIKADGKTLLDTLVRAGDEPQKLDLDMTDVVTLEIIVDRAREDDLGVGDHLNLADAKLIK